MPAHPLLAAAALAAFICAAAATDPYGCKYFSKKEIVYEMSCYGKTPYEIESAINSTRYVDFRLCKRCPVPSMQAKNTGYIKDGYSECWCAPGYGWSQREVKNNKTGYSTYLNKYKCSKCPDSAKFNYTGNSYPSTGPYLPYPEPMRPGTRNRWTKTACQRGQPAPVAPPVSPAIASTMPEAPTVAVREGMSAADNSLTASGAAIDPK